MAFQVLLVRLEMIDVGAGSIVRSPYSGLFVVPRTLPFTQVRSRAADALKIFVDSINSNSLGSQFKGRGLIQITGRFNCTACSTGLGLGRQLVDQPTRLTEDELAARSSGWFWSTNGLNALADRDDVFAVTRRINGGLNCIDDRIAKLGNAKRALRI